MQEPPGRVRVARMANGMKAKDMKIEGFKSIVCLTKSTAYGDLSPYDLWDEQGRNMENVWQFSKLYPTVPKTTQRRSRFDQTVIWEWPEETHVKVLNQETGEWTVTPEYLAWRKAGMNAKEAIRYPVGHNHRHTCKCAFAENPDGTINPQPLDYVQSRKLIYLPLYTRLVQKKDRFHKLRQEWLSGTNLLIIEVDGPHSESLSYYQQTYGVPENWIEHHSIECSKVNMEIMLNDPKHAFGHGYCLALAIQGIRLDGVNYN